MTICHIIAIINFFSGYFCYSLLINTNIIIIINMLLFHYCIFNLIHLFGYPSRKCVIKLVFSVILAVL